MPHPAAHAPPRARVGLVGLSGYSADILRLLRAESADPDGRTALAAVFAPDSQNHGPALAALAADGVHAHASYDALLADATVDAVWLPVPIHLHRPLAERALAAGKRVMLEKPVAGSVDDHDALARAEGGDGTRVLVGFQDVYRPSTAALKTRLLAGEWGAPRAAIVAGLWPRDDAYYARNDWAGAVRRDGAWVLDSPLSNAMAHYVNLALFLLGPAATASAQPERIAAALWRGRPGVEGFDTCSLRVGLAGTCDLVVTLGHATAELIDPAVEIDTDRGTLRVEYSGRATFAPLGGAPFELNGREDGRPHMARALGGAAAPVATLATSRPHTVVVSAATQAAAVVDAAAETVDWDGRRVRAIVGLAEATRAASRARRTLFEHGFGDARAGVLDGLSNYAHFSGPLGGVLV